MTSPLIRARNLRYQYEDGTLALDGVDFELHVGETVALLGANGSGKTTFVLQLNGLLQGSGQLRVCNLELTRQNLSQIRGKIGLVFQDSDDQLFMPTVLEDVAFGPLNDGLNRELALERARAALHDAGMSQALDRPPYHLSSGEKKRVAIAGVLVMRPEVLILDEPTTFLDPPAQRELLRTLRSLPQAKIVVTHDIVFAEAIATRAVFFEMGRIVAEGSVSDLVKRFDWRSY
jgi:cobalt/nickel transport system ATP-binding protein